MSEVKFYVGIGSNLGIPRQNVRSAVRALKSEPGFRFIAQSPWYRSKPVGPPGQDDYINGAALLRSAASAQEILTRLQGIEDAHGRVRSERWGARTLDLDLLLYGRDTIATSTLRVPHPELCRRSFVLRPLLDIDPELALPDGRALKDILPLIGEQDLARIHE